MSRSKHRENKPSAKPTEKQPVSPEESIPEGGGPKWGLLRLAQVLFTVALGISLYLAHTSLTNGSVAGCGAGSDCSTVLTSRWAYWFGLPVSVPASVFYVLILIASFLTAPSRTPADQGRAWTFLIGGAFAILAAALWFIGLQGAIIGHWCRYCLTAHALGATGSVLVLIAAPFVIRGPEGSAPLLFGVNRRASPAIFGILALIPLVVGQYLSKPPEAALATLPEGNAVAVASTNQPSTPAVAKSNEVVAAAPAAKPSRPFSLHNGRFNFDVYEAPLIGQPDATHVIVALFDYTCSHCRREHFILKRVQAVFGKELAIALIPMPLDKTCNPLLTATAPDHVNACVYARIGMAVWRAKPEIYGKYEEWFYETERPRSLEEVKAKAIELTGSTDFDAAMADPWIDKWLKLGRDVFKANWDASGRSYLPMLNVGQVLSSGELKGDDELYNILEKHLGLKRPTASAPTPGQ